MRLLSLALRNVLLHRWASSVLLVVFTITSFVLFWVLGYTNLIDRYLLKTARDAYGDVAFLTEFVRQDQVRELLASLPLEKVVFERELRGMLDSPNKSEMVILVELTPENRDRLAVYIRPSEGRLPEAEDEILVSEVFDPEAYKLGDRLFITATTHDKVINTFQYKVVGIAKSTGYKGNIGHGYMVSSASMDGLTTSHEHANLVYVFMRGDNGLQAAEALRDEIRGKLEAAGVTVKRTWTARGKVEALKSFELVLAGMRSLMLALLFPLLGGVVGAMIWMYAFRRRREIWTYQALGMKDAGVVTLIIMEYWLLATVGLAVGVGAGYLTSAWAYERNVWFHFSYTFVSPFFAAVGLSDILLIAVFMLVSIGVWMLYPLGRIVAARPFSY
jgi:ABC-type lipoprotein release transport system permease subunit